MNFPIIRRVVTGHDESGKAVVSSNGPLPTVLELSAVPGTVFHEVWSTSGAPAVVGNGVDPTLGPLSLPPPRLGTRIRFVDIPPDTSELIEHAAAGGQRGHPARHQPCLGQPVGQALPHALRAGGRHV